jgi:hypothetical protein
LISYRVTRAELEERIKAKRPTWLRRADERTARFRALGKYQEESSIWSEIKDVYMELQGGSKCAFCERKLETVDYGLAEQAVEHFRPKGRLRAWTLAPALAQQGISISAPPKKRGGYYLLAYDLYNYAASCHPCNSGLKKDHFPTEATPELGGERPESLAVEQPLLVYPIGDFDDPPENLIHFYGVSPQATADSGYPRRRALVTIEFFQLDSPSRKNLILERARIILALFPALKELSGHGSDERKALARKIVRGLASPRSPHTNCALSFKRLFEQDESQARDLFERAATLVESAS